MGLSLEDVTYKYGSGDRPSIRENNFPRPLCRSVIGFKLTTGWRRSPRPGYHDDRRQHAGAAQQVRRQDRLAQHQVGERLTALTGKTPV